MRILLVTHYFPPEIGAPQARLSELARTWAADGDDVTVLTGLPNHPTGVVPREYRGVRRLVEQVDGYRVVRTWLYATPNEGIAKKTLGHLSFMVTSIALGARAAGPADVVVVSSPTFFAILSAWFIARRKRARLVVEIRDLWPAIFVELGVLTNPFIIKALETIEMAAYRAADDVVVVSEGFRANLIERGVPAAKIHTIRNGVDLERFSPEPGDPGAVEASRAQLGARRHETLVLYIGAHGISHGLTSIAEAAALLGDQPIHFAFVGEGSAKAELQARVRDLALTNVTMLPGVPRDEVAGMLAAADICLVPLRDVPLFATFIPSKIFEYLGAGKAVIGAVRGEPADILRDGGAVVVEPEDHEALARAIDELARDPARRIEMGAAGHHYVSEHFDRRTLARTYRQILAKAGNLDCDARTEPSGRPGTPMPICERIAPTGPRAAAQVIRHIWTHPDNKGSGWPDQARAIGRFASWQLWERTVGRPWTITMPAGPRLRCYPHDYAATSVLYCGRPDYEEMSFLEHLLADGDVFVDVGANVGVYSLIGAAAARTTVHAFEPSTATFPRLVENIALNAMEERIRPHHVAVSHQSDRGRLTVGLGTRNRLVDIDDGPGTGQTAICSESVPVVALDDQIDDLALVAAIKIDVEGDEVDVLRGARRILEISHPALIIEANDREGIAEQLAPMGYKPCRFDPSECRLHESGWLADHGHNLLAVRDLDAAQTRLESR